MSSSSPKLLNLNQNHFSKKEMLELPNFDHMITSTI